MLVSKAARTALDVLDQEWQGRRRLVKLRQNAADAIDKLFKGTQVPAGVIDDVLVDLCKRYPPLSRQERRVSDHVMASSYLRHIYMRTSQATRCFNKIDVLDWISLISIAVRACIANAWNEAPRIPLAICGTFLAAAASVSSPGDRWHGLFAQLNELRREEALRDIDYALAWAGYVPASNDIEDGPATDELLAKNIGGRRQTASRETFNRRRQSGLRTLGLSLSVWRAALQQERQPLSKEDSHE
ncbi:MAG TPA: hypothetical protein VNO30_30780 [Kofleriaceae bacterium]|nr:hypothetical protein [Kofleriaceae bacterium]